MRLHWKQLFSVLAIFVFAMVVWGSTRTDSTRYDVTQTTTIGQTALKPGRYILKAKESKDQLRVLHHGRLVATVPCHWMKLAKKPNYSEIMSNKDRVTKVEFEGRREAVSIG
jgi:hypothetical protein